MPLMEHSAKSEREECVSYGQQMKISLNILICIRIIILVIISGVDIQTKISNDLGAGLGDGVPLVIFIAEILLLRYVFQFNFDV